MPEPDQVMPFGEALLAPAEKVAAEKSAGRILADPCVSCPPAVPLLISGERIGEEAVRCFRYYGISGVWCVSRSFDFSGGI
jgi:arginine/lysine/ornithine decarboxylase